MGLLAAGVLVLFAIWGIGSMGNVSEQADAINTPVASGQAMGYSVIIFALVGLTALALAWSVSPSRTHTTPRVNAARQATPQPGDARPAQWSNDYWADKAATREARNAQYKTP